MTEYNVKTEGAVQRLIEATAAQRKLKNYRAKCRIAKEWDEELGPILVDEAHRVGLDLSVALGLVQIETGPFANKNIFGCDQGGPFCNDDVTKERIKFLFNWISDGGNSTGVGPTQITHPPYLLKAEELGGAHKARLTMRIGFRIMKALVKKYDVYRAYVYYNGGEGTNNHYSWNTYAPRAFTHYTNYKNAIDAIGD